MAKKWSEDEMAFIKLNFLYMSNSELANHFGVTRKSIETKLRRMGLKRGDKLPRNRVERRKRLSAAQEQRLRKQAIQLLEAALKSISTGKKKEAKWQLARVIREYPDIVDIASAAREYMQRLKTE
jgi:transposase